VEAVNGADGASPPEEGPATTEVSPLAQAWKLKVEQDAEQQPDAEEAPGNVEEAPEPAAAEDGEKPKYDALHGTGDPADLYTEVQKAVASGDPFALASAICTWAPLTATTPPTCAWSPTRQAARTGSTSTTSSSIWRRRRRSTRRS
jgi:hypothetical protein